MVCRGKHFNFFKSYTCCSSTTSLSAAEHTHTVLFKMTS